MRAENHVAEEEGFKEYPYTLLNTIFMGKKENGSQESEQLKTNQQTSKPVARMVVIMSKHC